MTSSQLWGEEGWVYTFNLAWPGDLFRAAGRWQDIKTDLRPFPREGTLAPCFPALLLQEELNSYDQRHHLCY